MELRIHGVMTLKQYYILVMQHFCGGEQWETRIMLFREAENVLISLWYSVQSLIYSVTTTLMEEEEGKTAKNSPHSRWKNKGKINRIYLSELHFISSNSPHFGR